MSDFDKLALTSENHFKIYQHHTTLELISALVTLYDEDTEIDALFPFLVSYRQEAALKDYMDAPYQQEWYESLMQWERQAECHLPIRALREQCELDHDMLRLLFFIGILEEDGRLGLVYEALHGRTGMQHPTVSILKPLLKMDIHSAIVKLRHLELITIRNPDEPRSTWILQINHVLWDALCGRHAVPTDIRYQPPEKLHPLRNFYVGDHLYEEMQRTQELMRAGQVQSIIVRGINHNGRHTLLGALARTLDKGIVDVDYSKLKDKLSWAYLQTLALLLNAMLVIEFDLLLGDTVLIPDLFLEHVGMVLPAHGGLAGASIENSLTLTIDLPNLELRQQLWEHAFNGIIVSQLDDIAQQFRLSSGNIFRAAKLANTYAQLANHDEITGADVRRACQTLNRQSLDTLARYVETSGTWHQLAVTSNVQEELMMLEQRCRYREQLAESFGKMLPIPNSPGVRAVLSGPSGTGKTLSAKILAAALNKDLYMLDLATVVNKYIGETEKNLNKIFVLVEELDVVLLIDEGDALLAKRTGVHNSNDRYANLETNYLLQRLESFAGIVIITTNAMNHIDDAFQRRMDVVIDFRPPEAHERWQIWHLHLPPNHAVDKRTMNEIATHCHLTGGQIRNAALHASLLAIDTGQPINSDQLRLAIQREYRKTGDICPLRPVQNNGHKA